ncbi:MAG: CYTH domain-containing protein, partial [Pseudomonadota bacterium]
MQEIELKFQIPTESLAALQERIKLLPGSEREHLQAHYVDTLERQLGNARMALRLRKEGRRWVQTLKAGGSNTMMRLEDNRPAKAPLKSHPIPVDLSLHCGGPAEQVLAKILGWDPETDPHGHHTGLIELYRTDIWRLKARQAVAQGTPHAGVVELALDIGHIRAGDLSLPVQELEIELIEGHPQAVIEAAREWVATHALWLDTQTKAHRGDRLAKQAAANSPLPVMVIKARAAAVDKHSTVDEAWRAGLESCLEQIIDNMSELASQASAPAPSLYQWRVGLRRLRTLGKLMKGQDTAFPHAALPAVADVFQALGAQRDQEVLASIQSTLTSLGGPDLTVPDAGSATAAVALARAPSTTLTCL